MCDDEIRKVYDWKYAKPMKDLTQEDLKTMNKQDLKELLGLPGIAYSTHAPFPKQAVGVYKVRGFSTMTHPELVKMVLEARDKKIAKGEQFLSLCGGRWVNDPNPMVRWGKPNMADLRERHTLAMKQATQHLPPNIAAAVVPRSRHLHEIGDVLFPRYGEGRFYKVVGHTKGGNPQLKELRHKIVSELNDRINNSDRKTVQTYRHNSKFLEPNLNQPPFQESIRWDDSFSKWNGKPKLTSRWGYEQIEKNHAISEAPIKKLFSVGDILENDKKFFKVVGHTPTGDPKLQEFRQRIIYISPDGVATTGPDGTRPLFPGSVRYRQFNLPQPIKRGWTNVQRHRTSGSTWEAFKTRHEL
jgi:hypothetical protein